MKARNLIVLIIATLTIGACCTVCIDDTPPMTPIKVRLRISGAAHLVDKHDPPLIVMPNFAREEHHALLLATEPFVAKDGLPLRRDQVDLDNVDDNGQPVILGKYLYANVGGGIEVDLQASGAIAAPGSPVQMPDPADDSNAACPAAQGITTGSLHWLPRLTRVTKASQPLRLKDSFTRKDPDPEDVALRMELSGGRLEAELTPQQRKFRFVIGGQPADDDVVQTVAMSLMYTFQAEIPEGAPFVLKGRRFGTGGNADTLVELGRFQPRMDPIDGLPTVEINLMNIPPEDFFRLQDTASIPHFHLHYRIVDGNHDVAVPEFTGGVCAGATQPLFECGPSRP